MLLSHFNREQESTAIIFEFLGKGFRNLKKLCLGRTFPLREKTSGFFSEVKLMNFCLKCLKGSQI